jgi:CheY-like chemotaxis protein
MRKWSFLMVNRAIVCVDDEAIILMAMKQELKHHFGSRFLYETALSAEEALQIIQELGDEGISVIIVISDWLMPGMKGDEFLVLVHQKFPHIRTIMVTGQADEAAIERAVQEAKISACLRKPWKSRELMSAIEDILDEQTIA